MEEIQLYIDDAKESMHKALKHTEVEFQKVRAGKASPAMLQGLTIEYYGIMTPIDQASSMTTPDARTIAIKPFEKKLINTIEKAIRDANLGFNPQNDGETIRISIPPLTEERRKNLVKQVRAEAESGKVRIRSIRKDTNEELRKLLKEGASEDDIKTAEEKIQALTNEYNILIDKVTEKKEAEVMTI
ncbi:MAG: ribosome recycling factor [Cytophagales bacterium]|nr:MAG: ribosome recycling factor [Cytophagales bacterium]